MSDLSPLNLISGRQDRLERRLGEAEGSIDRIPVLETQVEMLTKAVDRLTSVVFQAAIAIVATGVLSVVAALILKGVIG